MQIGKRFLLGLLVLVSISLIFTTPGSGIFELYSIFHKTNPYLFLTFPPGIQKLLNIILYNFPLDGGEMIFYHQIGWIASKILIYIGYVGTLFSIYFLVRSARIRDSISFFDLSLAFFACIPILLISVSLGFFDILAAPFFFLALGFWFRKKIGFFVSFYILAVLFDWVIIFFLPAILLPGLIGKIKKIYVIVFLAASILTPFIFRGRWIYDILDQTRLQSAISVLNQLIKTSMKMGDGFWIIIPIGVFLCCAYLIVRFLGGVLLNKGEPLNNKSLVVLFERFLSILFVFLILFPIYPEGTVAWLVLFALCYYCLKPSWKAFYYLLAVNLTAFVWVYNHWGITGRILIRGQFFENFQYIFYIFFLLLAQKSFLERSKDWIKKYIVWILAIFNVSQIPAQGEPDTDNWARYNLAIVKYVNPFYAHTRVIQLYAPLSTVILGFFALAWNKILGPDPTYAIATKIGLFLFFLLTALFFLRFGDKLSKRKFSLLDKLLIILTTYLIGVQSQGMGEINIYLMPFILASVYLLFRKKYFFSGLLLGLACSIKWQPVIIAPLFGAAIFHFQEPFKKVLKNSFYFLTGFIPAATIFWLLVIAQPEGLTSFNTAFNLYFKSGGVYLSGQALNINWIVTYVKVWPETIGHTLQSVGSLNQPIASYAGPWVFRGILFQIVTFLILFKFWLFQKKNIINFLSAAVMVFFSHYAINVSAMELHLIYPVILMLYLYLIRPTSSNRIFLTLLNAMGVVSVVIFYGLTGDAILNRRIFGSFDITIIFAAYYMIIYFWVLWRYFKGGLILENDEKVINEK